MFYKAILLIAALCTEQISYGMHIQGPRGVLQSEQASQTPRSISQSQTTASTFNSFELGNSNGIQTLNVQQTISQEREIGLLKGQAESIGDQLISLGFSQEIGATKTHVTATESFGYQDYAANSVALNQVYEQNKQKIRDAEQTVFQKYGESIYSLVQKIQTMPLKDQEYVYKALIVINSLKVDNQQIKGNITHNQQMMSQFDKQTAQEAQNYGQSISGNQITNYQRTEIPNLKKNRSRIETTIKDLKQERARLFQRFKELETKIAAFSGKLKDSIPAHVNAFLDSERNKDSLVAEQANVSRQIGQFNESIGKWENLLIRVNAKLDYVQAAIKKYQETSAQNAEKIGSRIEQSGVNKNSEIVQALDATVKNQGAFDTPIQNTLTPNAQKLLSANNIATDLYAPTIGNPVQAHLCDSVVTIINETAESYDAAIMTPEQRDRASATIDACDHAMQTILNGTPEQAIIATTFAHELAAANTREQDFVESFINGVLHGIISALDNDIQLVRHPIQTLKPVAQAICDLGWFLVTAEPDQVGDVVLNLPELPKFDHLTPQQQVQEVTKFVTSILCPSPLILTGGSVIHAAQSLRSAQKTVKSFEKVLQAEATSIEASAAYKAAKTVATGSANAQESAVLVQATTNVAKNAERSKAPLLTRFKEKLTAPKKEQLVAATEHGPVNIGQDVKMAREAEEVAKIRGGSGAIQATPTVENPTTTTGTISTTNPKVETPNTPETIGFFENNLTHIFKNEENHLLDTLENRKMLLDTAAEKSNYLGVDSRGNHWFAKLLPDGKQVWASVRDNRIRNGGLNEKAITFNPKTGLCKTL